MNKSQEKARRWLCSNQGFKPNELEFTADAPTFVTKDGKGFLVKYAPYGTARFYPHEMGNILQNVEKNNIVLVPPDGEIKMMPARSLVDTPSEWGGFKLHYAELGINGNQGEIVLRLTTRTSESRYRRINHVPMDSILMFKTFETELKKSMDGNKLGIFLVLRPQEFA